MEILHALFSVAGPLITLLGVFVSLLGTYLLTKWYHPYTEQGFVQHLLEAPDLAMLILFRKKQADPIKEVPQVQPRVPTADEKRLEKLDTIARLARVNEERRSVSLVGIDLIFIGFAFQGIGAAASLVDVIWTNRQALTHLFCM